MTKHHIGKIVEENGELLMILPPELLNRMGWDESTLLEWLSEDGDISLREAQKEK